MYKKAFFLLCLLISTLSSFAQREKIVNTKAILVVGKILSASDSSVVKELYFDGLQEKIAQNYQQAIKNFQNVIEIDPANDAALYELAMAYHYEGQENEAERLIRNAITVKSDNIWYWILLADIYKKTKKLDELVVVFDELINLSPETEDYYLDKANALLRQNKIDEALDVYNNIEKRFGLSDELSTQMQRAYLQQGNPDKVKAQLEKQIESNPSELHNYLRLGEIYTKLGDKEKAISILQKAKAIDPANALVRLSLADSYRSINKFNDAFVELKVAFEDVNLNIDEKVRIVLSFFPLFADAKARAYADELATILVRIHPDDPKASAVYGDVLFQEQKYPQAIEAYRKALKLNDQVYQIWEQLVRIEISEGKYQEAITDGDAALAIFPNQAALYMYTGIAYAQTQKHEKAVSYLKNAVSLQIEDKETLGQIYTSLGDSYHALKRYSDSDDAYEKALEFTPNNSYTLNNYAYYLSLRGENLAKAEAMSKKSNELIPDNASSQDTYAWILFRLKKYNEAQVWIEKALRNSKGNSATQIEHYGDILFHLGEKQKAIEQWQKALESGAKSEQLGRKINEKKYIE